MECKENECKLCELYPNTNAGVACDNECYFDKAVLQSTESSCISNCDERKYIYIIFLYFL